MIDIAKGDALGGLNYLFSSGLISSIVRRVGERLGFTLPPITSLTCRDKGTNGTWRALTRTIIEEGQLYPRGNKLHFFFPVSSSNGGGGCRGSLDSQTSASEI
jgi:hypothetical protein